MLSNDIRRNVDLYLVLLGEPDPPKTILFRGSGIKHLNPDERSTGALVKKALAEDVWQEEVMTSEGVYVSKRGLVEVLHDLNGPRVYLREDGKDIGEVPLGQNSVFVLGGHEDLTVEEEEILDSGGEVVRISLGPNSLHTDHCITIVLNELDR